MAMPTPRHGSVFLVALMLLTVLVVLAFGFIRTLGVVARSARTLDLQELARAAARSGTAHACGEISADFLSSPGVPTTLGGRFRTSFLPIDTYMQGKDTATVNDDAPLGLEFSPGDLNENDSKTENLLTELYCGVVSTAGDNGAYNNRGNIFRDGRLMHPGGARYIEPGRYHRDLVGKPVSFHLAHPVAADASSTDPAKKHGEPWIPDLDQPLLLDGEMRRTEDPDAVRYRLRYAVAVEDLGGHLLLGAQGPFIPGATTAAGGPVPEAEQEKVLEVDLAVAKRYRDSFTNMALVTDGTYPFWAWSSFQGLGFKPPPSDATMSSPLSYGVLARVDGLVPKVSMDYDTSAATPPGEPDRRYQTPLPAGALAHFALQGVPYSFQAAQESNAGGDSGRNLAYVWTPFGHPGSTAAASDDWRSDPVGVPWRVNLPTAAPKVIATMLFAYLPQEAKTFEYSQRTKDNFNGFDAITGEPRWTGAVTTPLVPTVRSSYPTVNLFAAPSAFASRFAHLGAQPYPGSAPDLPGTDWNDGLGKDIDINSLPFDSTAKYCRSALWGQGGGDGSYLQRLNSTVTEKEEQWPGGQRWVLTMSGATDALTKSRGYWYEDSYWLDLTVAFAHACGVAQLAWNSENGASWRGSPGAGTARYPAGWSDPEYGANAGQPMLDLDVDADSQPDSPSLFDSIADIDRQFVKNMGEWPEQTPMGSRSASPHPGLYLTKAQFVTSIAVAKSATPSNNIRSLLAAGAITPGNAMLMELALNDMRLSFFGASPQYPDFHPIDFDDDGTARCSAYAGGSAPADPATGYGPIPPFADRFSLTGCLVMQKSRYYRIFVRGEVFDTLARLPVARSDEETVLCLDPEGRVWNLDNQPVGGTPRLESRILFQRQLWNRYLGYAARGEQQ